MSPDIRTHLPNGLHLTRRRRAQGLGLTVLGLAVLFVVLFPLLWMVLSSFKPETEMYQQPPAWLPIRWTFENYERLLATTSFLRYIANATMVAFGAVLIGVSISLAAVYSVTRFRIIGGKLFTYLILFIYMLPPILLAIPIYGMWFRLGLTNRLSTLMVTYLVLTVPFGLWILKPYIESIPLELEESAMIDGCTQFQAFRRVILPQALPGVIAATVFTFVVVWNEYLFALVLITDPTKRTVSLGIATLILEASVTSWGMINAAGVLVTVPVLVLFIFLSKALISGMMSGSLK